MLNPHPNPQISLERVAKTRGPLLLVEGRGDDSDEGPRRYSPRCHILKFSYLLLGNEPISGSHFSVLLHIFSLYKNITDK
jgi:hypothetical protein